MEEHDIILNSGQKGIIGETGSNKLAIFVHGFGGSTYEHHWMQAKKALYSHQIDVLRIDLYWRGFDRTSLSDSIYDLNKFLEFYSGSYDEVHVIGHSLGGLVVPEADQSKMASMVLLDPTTGFSDPSEKNFSWSECLGKWISYKRTTKIVSDALVKEWMSYDIEQIARQIRVPVKFIFAERYNKYDLWKTALKFIQFRDVSFVDSDHTFTFPDKADEVSDLIYRWIDSGWKHEDFVSG